MRLALKLSLLLALASAGPLLLATAVTVPSSRAELRRQLDDAYQQSARALAGAVNQKLSEKLEALSLAANALPFATLEAEPIVQALRLIYRQTRSASIVGLFDEKGDAVIEPVHVEDPVAAGFAANEHEPIDGAALARYAQQVPLKAALGAGLAVGPVYVGMDSAGAPIPRAVVAVAVPGRTGRWVLAVELSLRDTLEQVAKVRIGERGHAFLLDGGGKVVAHPDSAQVRARADLSAHPVAQGLTGAGWFGARAPVPLVGWTLGIAQPSSEALAPIQRQVRWALMWAAAGLLAAFALGFTTVRTVTRPVAQLSRAAANVERGKLNEQVQIGGRDELAALGNAFNAMTRGLRERERLRRSFSRYISEAAASRILREREDYELEAEQAEVTILFVTVRGLERFSARHSPAEAIELLNAYLEIIVREVGEQQGFINKFMGGAAMAVFGIPKETGGAELRACWAGLRILQRVQELNAERSQRGQDALRFAIGASTGESVAGNVGAPERMEYSVVGEAVSLAEQLQRLAKDGELVVCGSTASRVQEHFAIQSRGGMTIEGKPTSLYLVTGRKAA